MNFYNYINEVKLPEVGDKILAFGKHWKVIEKTHNPGTGITFYCSTWMTKKGTDEDLEWIQPRFIDKIL